MHPINRAVLALAGRDEPRDRLNVLYQDREVLGLGPLCWAACGKDPGLTPRSLLELLRRRGRVREEDLARLALTEPVDLVQLKSHWLAALDRATEFVSARPASEVGCLYYSASRQAFVDPTTVPDAVTHYGRPGGVLPRIREDP